MGIEPTTTSLPRRCSTTEPPRQTQIEIKKAGDGNRTRMASLEGWSTTTVLLPHSKWGRMDLNHRRTKSGRFTVCCTRPLCDTPTTFKNTKKRTTLKIESLRDFI